MKYGIILEQLSHVSITNHILLNHIIWDLVGSCMIPLDVRVEISGQKFFATWSVTDPAWNKRILQHPVRHDTWNWNHQWKYFKVRSSRTQVWFSRLVFVIVINFVLHQTCCCNPFYSSFCFLFECQFYWIFWNVSSD